MKKDIKQVNSIASKYKLTHAERFALGDYIHARKSAGDIGSGPDGDFTYHELEEMAIEIVQGRTER